MDSVTIFLSSDRKVHAICRVDRGTCKLNAQSIADNFYPRNFGHTASYRGGVTTDTLLGNKPRRRK